MTVKRLNNLRLAALGFLCAATAYMLIFVPRAQWLMPLAGILLLLLWMRMLLSRMQRHVNRIGYEAMDPELLERELMELSRLLKRPSTRKNRNLIHRLSGLLHELRGEYPQAVNELLQIDPGKRGLPEGIKWDAARLYLREGKPAMAKALIQQVMAVNPSYAGPTGPVQLHVAGLLHLEQGELRQAAERLTAALALAIKPVTRLNCLYDLARLYEMTGEGDKAMGHYRQAEVLAPKTWVGRKAAGRFESRDDTGSA